MLKGLGCFKFSLCGFSVVALCHGKEDGKDFYAFVAIEPQNYRYFKKRYMPGAMSSFKAFGYELVRGWGTEPPQAVKDNLLVKYGVEFGISETFLNHLAANIEPESTPVGRSYSSMIASAQMS